MYNTFCFPSIQQVWTQTMLGPAKQKTGIEKLFSLTPSSGNGGGKCPKGVDRMLDNKRMAQPKLSE